MGFDYFENSRRATLAQYEYGKNNPLGFKDYSKFDWGWTACDGPGDAYNHPQGLQPHNSLFAPRIKAITEANPATIPGRTTLNNYFALQPAQRHYFSYIARGAPESTDDGTIAPTAAASSIAFAPEVVLPTLYHWRLNRPEIWSNNGFKDAFNPTADPKKPSGWVDTDSLGIDQGPIVLMTENYRSGMVWDTMKKDPYLVKGLKQAGFTGGWLK